jgi:murein DD-endopeptidase MepM/ murein hydrolase activator NlpD
MRVLRLSARLMMSAAAAVLLSACSSSLERFSASNSSYENPSDADPVYTAAIPKRVKPAQNVQIASEETLSEDLISSKPLAKTSMAKQPLSYDYENSYKKVKPKKAALSLDESLDRSPSYEQPDVQPATTQTRKRVVANTTPVAVPKSGRIRVEPGMTLHAIAKSNGLSVEELAVANGLSKPYWVSAGTVLLLPGVSTPIVPQANLQAQVKKPVSLAEEEEQQVQPYVSRKQLSASASSHTVGNGETLYSLGRKYGVSPFAIAETNGLDRNTSLKIGQSVKIPGGSNSTVAVAQPVVTKPKAAKTEVARIEEETISDEPALPVIKPKRKLTLEDDGEDVVVTKPTKQAKISGAIDDSESAVGEDQPATAAPEEKIVSTEPVKPKLKVREEAPAQDTAAQALALRWPVRGKVISEFGPKSGGMKNEGINISVPEGTSVRAAESGVIAYAGSELKGYGNLILIRHAGGYVTAYAHAKELLVKRGDKVGRGDVIAKAGQSGAVSSPQLHFEVRKGAAALDPQKFLGSSTAMN